MIADQNEFWDLCAAGKCSGPAPESLIKHAQAELSMSFPEEYVGFLKRYGALIAPGVGIYGLPNTAPGERPFWRDVVVVAKELQSWGQAGTEDASFLPFSDDGAGVYFFFNTRVSPKTEIWAVGPGVEKLLSTSLYRFAVDSAEGRVAL